MAKKNKELSVAKRAEELMMFLGAESPEVRNEIANSFPAYNSLLNLYAKSFEEFALLPIARERKLAFKDPLFNYKDVLPPCPKCQKNSKIIHKGKDGYQCGNCNTKFQANHNSLSSGFRCSSLVWRKVLHCMLEFYSLKRACDYCGISANTYYNIRNRIFYAMQLLMSEVKLYGHIQCDNTFVYLSYKGSKIQNDEYPEDSPFADMEICTRDARKRGGSYENAKRNSNTINIFAAIDEFGHSMVRMVCVGAASARKLFNTVGSMKYLYTVPQKDPFDLFVPTRGQFHSNAGTNSCLISDGESAIKKYASKIQIKFESHVYRKNGKQLRLSADSHNIQKVNSLHSRLKSYLRKLNYVSSKYLPGFLVMFEFIENTSASEEAIGRLFEILARPNLGRDSNFFESMFVIPSVESENPVIDTTTKKAVKLGTRKIIQAIYLYDLLLKEPNSSLSLSYISQITGYTAEELKEMYEQTKNSNMLETINNAINDEKHKKEIWVQSTVPRDYIVYYDEFAALRKRSITEQTSLRQFVYETNNKYQKEYSYKMVQFYFKRIVQFGLREPIPKKRDE